MGAYCQDLGDGNIRCSNSPFGNATWDDSAPPVDGSGFELRLSAAREAGDTFARSEAAHTIARESALANLIPGLAAQPRSAVFTPMQPSHDANIRRGAVNRSIPGALPGESHLDAVFRQAREEIAGPTGYMGTGTTGRAALGSVADAISRAANPLDNRDSGIAENTVDAVGATFPDSSSGIAGSDEGPREISNILDAGKIARFLGLGADARLADRNDEVTFSDQLPVGVSARNGAGVKPITQDPSDDGIPPPPPGEDPWGWAEKHGIMPDPGYGVPSSPGGDVTEPGGHPPAEILCNCEITLGKPIGDNGTVTVAKGDTIDGAFTVYSVPPDPSIGEWFIVSMEYDENWNPAPKREWSMHGIEIKYIGNINAPVNPKKHWSHQWSKYQLVGEGPCDMSVLFRLTFLRSGNFAILGKHVRTNYCKAPITVLRDRTAPPGIVEAPLCSCNFSAQPLGGGSSVLDGPNGLECFILIQESTEEALGCTVTMKTQGKGPTHLTFKVLDTQEEARSDLVTISSFGDPLEAHAEGQCGISLSVTPRTTMDASGHVRFGTCKIVGYMRNKRCGSITVHVSMKPCTCSVGPKDQVILVEAVPDPLGAGEKTEVEPVALAVSTEGNRDNITWTATSLKGGLTFASYCKSDAHSIPTWGKDGEDYVAPFDCITKCGKIILLGAAANKVAQWEALYGSGEWNDEVIITLSNGEKCHCPIKVRPKCDIEYTRSLAERDDRTDELETTANVAVTTTWRAGGVRGEFSIEPRVRIEIGTVWRAPNCCCFYLADFAVTVKVIVQAGRGTMTQDERETAARPVADEVKTDRFRRKLFQSLRSTLSDLASKMEGAGSTWPACKHLKSAECASTAAVLAKEAQQDMESDVNGLLSQVAGKSCQRYNKGVRIINVRNILRYYRPFLSLPFLSPLDIPLPTALSDPVSAEPVADYNARMRAILNGLKSNENPCSILIWVHGFINGETVATERFHKVADALYGSARADCKLYGFMWQSDPLNETALRIKIPYPYSKWTDTDWTSLGDAMFNAGEKAANISADALGRTIAFLHQQFPKADIHVAGHSLGTRVILGALQSSHLRGMKPLASVTLIEAAVNADVLSPGGEFSSAPSMTEKLYVVFSVNDEVLYGNLSSFYAHSWFDSEGYWPSTPNLALGSVGPRPRANSSRICPIDMSEIWDVKPPRIGETIHSSVYFDCCNYLFWNYIMRNILDNNPDAVCDKTYKDDGVYDWPTPTHHARPL